eukprot:g434.t1
MPGPINPFSPKCLIFPDSDGCEGYINGFAPANCTGLSSPCKEQLFRLVNQTIPEIELYYNFTLENRQCANESFSPCWSGTLHDGHLVQGSCTIDCRNGWDVVEKDCAAHGGSVCPTEIDLGLDGTEVKVTWPTCLPAVCDEDDYRNIQQCIIGHTCDAGPPQVHQLLPECAVDLQCIPVDHSAIYILAIIFSCAGILFLLLIVNRIRGAGGAGGGGKGGTGGGGGGGGGS